MIASEIGADGNRVRSVKPEPILIADGQRADARNDVRMLLPRRMRAARAKDVFVDELAAQVARATLQNLERGLGQPSVFNREGFAILTPRPP